MKKKVWIITSFLLIGLMIFFGCTQETAELKIPTPTPAPKQIPEQTKTPTPTLTPMPMLTPTPNFSGWKTYRHESFGYRFKYPSNWFIRRADFMETGTIVLIPPEVEVPDNLSYSFFKDNPFIGIMPTERKLELEEFTGEEGFNTFENNYGIRVIEYFYPDPVVNERSYHRAYIEYYGPAQYIDTFEGEQEVLSIELETVKDKVTTEVFQKILENFNFVQ